MIFSKTEHQAMATAIKIAQKGRYHTQPNPMVGCVISDENDQIIAQGYHQKYGSAHAEIVALNALKKLKPKIKRATLKMFITLEPCCFSAKTPPCTDAILKSGIQTIIVAMLDPNPKVCGKGIAQLKDANLNVAVGLLANEARVLNPAFIKAMQSAMPFVRCKIAMSLDAKIAMRDGQSQWISNHYARLDGQKLRMQSDAILTGSGTVLADNPYMTVRDKQCTRRPIRIVLDSNCRISRQANIFSNDAPTQHYSKNNAEIINAQIALQPLLKKLQQQEIYHILLEAGTTLVSSMLAEQLIDEFIFYIAPMFMGSNTISAINLPLKTLNDAIDLQIKSMRMIGDNLKIIATVNYD